MESKSDLKGQSQMIHESEATFIAAGIFNENSCVDQESKCGQYGLDESLDKECSKGAKNDIKALLSEKNTKGHKSMGQESQRKCRNECQGKVSEEFPKMVGENKENQKGVNCTSALALGSSCKDLRGRIRLRRCRTAPDEAPCIRSKVKSLEVILEEKDIQEEKVKSDSCKQETNASKLRKSELGANNSKSKGTTGVEAVVESLYAKKMKEMCSKKEMEKKQIFKLQRDDGLNSLRKDMEEEALEERPPANYGQKDKNKQTEAKKKTSLNINSSKKVNCEAVFVKDVSLNKVTTKESAFHKDSQNATRKHGNGPCAEKPADRIRQEHDERQSSKMSDIKEDSPAGESKESNVCIKGTSNPLSSISVLDEKESVDTTTHNKGSSGELGPDRDRNSPKTLMEKVEVIDQSDGNENLRETLRLRRVSDVNCPVNTRQTSTDASKPSEVYLILPHAVECKGAKCRNRDCYIANQFILHVSACYQQSKGGCHICIAMDAMVCKHAKICSIPLHESCPIPSCNKVKVKVLEQWMKLKVKHNELMQRAFEIKVHARTCRSNCSFGKSCKTMKKVILHVNKCQKGDTCPTRKFLSSICMNHKDGCQKESCTIDICRKEIKDSSTLEDNIDDENKENIDPIRKLNVPLTSKSGKVEVAESMKASKDKKKTDKGVDNAKKTLPSASATIQANKGALSQSQGNDNTLQGLSKHLNSTSAVYENFSFFSNVYQPDMRLITSTQSHTTTVLNSDQTTQSCSSARKTEIERLGSSVQGVELSPHKRFVGVRNVQPQESISSPLPNKDIFPRDERGESLLKSMSMSEDQQDTDLDFCNPLHEAERTQETSSTRMDNNYRLYSLWPDPSSSLPTFSPTEIQKILRVNSHDLNDSQKAVAESESVEDILNLKDINVNLPEKALYSHCLEGRNRKPDVGKQRKTKDNVMVLTTPESHELKTKVPHKRHCARRLFPLDEESSNF